MDVVAEFLTAKQRAPALGGSVDSEHRAAQYLASALERRHVSTRTGPQLTQAEVEQWASVFRGLPEGAVQAWAPDPVLA